MSPGPIGIARQLWQTVQSCIGASRICCGWVLDLAVLHQLAIQDLIAAIRHGYRRAYASLEDLTWL